MGTGRAEGHSLDGGAQGKLDWGKGEGQVQGNGILNQRTKSFLWIIWLLIGFDFVLSWLNQFLVIKLVEFCYIVISSSNHVKMEHEPNNPMYRCCQSDECWKTPFS